MKKLIIVFLISAMPLASAQKGTVIADKVNMRSGPSVKYRIKAALNRGDELYIISKKGKEKFTGKYLGTWYRVKLESGKRGYVLSSFIETGSDDAEKFHIFFEKFKENLSKGDEEKLTPAAELPLTIEDCQEGKCTRIISKKAGELIEKINIREPYTYAVKFSYNKNTVTCAYGYEGASYTLSFHLRDGKWKLVKVKIVRC